MVSESPKNLCNHLGTWLRFVYDISDYPNYHSYCIREVALLYIDGNFVEVTGTIAQRNKEQFAAAGVRFKGAMIKSAPFGLS